MTRVVDGRYELRDRLGAGGMGEVWRGFDTRLGRDVAVKLLNVDVPDPTRRQRFEREARAAASFSHPNAVTVYDFGEEGARPYLVMELVEGRTLADVIAEQAPLDPEEAVAVARQVLSALAAAHRHGLVHRDVKPGNVLMAPDGRVKLADFGIATTVGGAAGALTATGELLGTPTYLSPEQVGGEPATPRSDLYATGVVLYEMLAGSPPFTGETPMAVALAHQQSPVPSLAERRPDVDPVLAAAVERALAKDPAQRYADADAMSAALAGAVGSDGRPMGAADTIALSPGDTMVLEREAVRDAPAAGARRSRWPLWAALAAVALLAVLALAARDDERPTSAPSTSRAAAPPTSVALPTSAVVPRLPTTEAPTASTVTTFPGISPERVALAALTEQVATSPGTYGEKGPDLVRALNDVQRANANRRADRAADAAEDIAEWVSEGKLDPGIGAAAIQLLQRFAG